MLVLAKHVPPGDADRLARRQDLQAIYCENHSEIGKNLEIAVTVKND
jgi:hypothetical protein